MSSFDDGPELVPEPLPATDAPSAPCIHRPLRTQVLGLDEPEAWSAVVRRSTQHDVYHLPEYHALARELGEGTGLLFVASDGSHTIALPLLLRSLTAVPGLEEAGRGWTDATSVYGYAGPLASHATFPPVFVERFQAALRQFLTEQHVVSVFSRLHPLLPDQASLLAGLGECRHLGKTVSIDLTLPEKDQLARYSRWHTKNLRRARQNGVTCALDPDNAHLHEFLAIYDETMARVGAAPYFFFPPAHFERLLAALRHEVHLFVCFAHGEMAAGGLFTLCDGIVQGYLLGSRKKFASFAPGKFVFETVRSWACRQGAWVFHLGGGLGAQETSLFRFKAGFSERRHDFRVWRWVVCPDVYQQLCRQRQRREEEMGFATVSPDYFPVYRRPGDPISLRN